jgi:dipeptidase E
VKRQIVAMGGGGFSIESDNVLLDEYTIRQAGTDNPQVCFVPTASGDAQDYVASFYHTFQRFTCRPSHLSLFALPTRDLEGFLLDKDIVYVGGGNTRSLLALWREWGIDTILRKAWERGVVLAGISSGAVCWYEQALSDYFPGELNVLRCLGILPGSLCPHYDSEPERRPVYRNLVARADMPPGIGADDGVALHYVGTVLHAVVASRPSAGAWCVSKDGKDWREERLALRYLGA